MTESVLLKKKEVREAINFIRQVTNFRPRLALILGSGLGNFSDRINAISTVSSSEIPYYPVSSVQGHAGKLIFGYLQKDTLHSMPLLVFQGRVHFYEIGSLERVVFPIILSHQLGIKKLIITNAAGGINSCFNAGDLMLIQDILNLAGIQLPTTPNDSVLPNQKYSNYFDSNMRHRLLQCASQIKIPLQQGTYGWLKGPSYETPAEIQMLKRIGVDAVGMSTVPEIFLARSFGMKTVGISLISNLAAGISSAKLFHADVTETGTKVIGRFSELMEQLVLSLKQ
jgi:inosine guanosine and xanthosine phosphorylase family